MPCGTHIYSYTAVPKSNPINASQDPTQHLLRKSHYNLKLTALRKTHYNFKIPRAQNPHKPSTLIPNPEPQTLNPKP